MALPTDSARFVIALGSNRSGRHGRPGAELAAALRAIGGIVTASSVIDTAPLGPSLRRYRNMAAIVASDEPPPVLLARLKQIEAAFGRRRGQRWGARVIDLDIILWSRGAWSGTGLTIPHPEFRTRAFVLGPVAQIAPDWRDPISGLTMRQLARRQRAVDRAAKPS